MKKTLLSILLFLSFITIAVAQQLPQYSHYMFFNSGLNPGHYGMSGQICANLISHDQWLGWDKAPKTRLLTIDMPLDLFGLEQGVGISINSDILGFENNFSAQVGYAYHKAIFGAGRLGIGFNVGMYNKMIDGGGFSFPEQDESEIFSSLTRKMVLDIDLGVFYTYENLYAGASIKHLNRAKLIYTEAGDYQLKNHFLFTGGYNIQLANALIDLTPSFLIKSDIVSTQYDINLLLKYNKKIWGGVTYRNKDALVFFAGGKIYNDIRLGLSYDLTISRIQTVSNGTFEVYVGYCFEFGKVINPKQYRSVRFL